MQKAIIAMGILGMAWIGGQNQPIQVPYREVGSRVQILGQFGLPLGTYLVLEGVRFGTSTGPTMMGGGNFRVISVNGKPVPQKTELWIAKIKGEPTGKHFKIEGYETGGMIGVPREVERKTGSEPQQALWQFRVEFVPASVKN